ncbi:MAG: hypothetical protein HZA78_02555 [Candidatus Schekmanbacteria bacterium]|nr:hypothetical protein [Candidatus Schekmanbacteria bacterium]
MKNEDRRKELGKMLMDIAKYLATIGLIGGMLTQTLNFINGIVIVLVVLILTIVAFFTIPSKGGD